MFLGPPHLAQRLGRVPCGMEGLLPMMSVGAITYSGRGHGSALTLT